MRKACAFILIFAAFNVLHAQKPVDSRTSDPNRIINIQFNYSYYWPAGDMAPRYGPIHNIGFGGLYKSSQNWVLALDWSYQFGNEVNEPLLYNLTNGSGVISNTGGFEASYAISERGTNGFVKFGRLFPLSTNLNSGIVVMAGGGVFSHKINIAHAKNDIPTLTEELTKGYDRLAWGPAITAFAGYHFQSRNRFVNFYAGFDYIQAFTTNRREYNYDQRAFDTESRNDILYGFRFGWMIPIYLTNKGQDEFQYK